MPPTLKVVTARVTDFLLAHNSTASIIFKVVALETTPFLWVTEYYKVTSAITQICRNSVVLCFVYDAGDMGSIPRSGRFPGVGNGNPLQYSCLENSVDRGAWWATVHRLQRVRHNSVTNTFTLHTPGFV